MINWLPDTKSYQQKNVDYQNLYIPLHQMCLAGSSSRPDTPSGTFCWRGKTFRLVGSGRKSWKAPEKKKILSVYSSPRDHTVNQHLLFKVLFIFIHAYISTFIDTWLIYLWFIWLKYLIFITTPFKFSANINTT